MTLPASAAAWVPPGNAKETVREGTFAVVKSEETDGILPLPGTSSRQRQKAAMKLTKHAKTQIHGRLRINRLT
jgi:hypothetical protein